MTHVGGRITGGGEAADVRGNRAMMSEKEWWRCADALTAQDTPARGGPSARLTRVLVAGGLVAGLTALAGRRSHRITTRRPARPTSRHRGSGRGGGHDDGKDGGGLGARNVRCDPDALILALSLANANNGGSLSLAPRCTYTLTASSGGNGLPTITERITIQRQRREDRSGRQRRTFQILRDQPPARIRP